MHKLQHWRAFQAEKAWKRAPTLPDELSALLAEAQLWLRTQRFHSSKRAGWRAAITDFDQSCGRSGRQ